MSVESGIADVLRGLPGLRVAEEWPDQINSDQAIVVGPLSYEDADMAGCRVIQLYEIDLLFSLQAGISRTHQRLMPYLAPSGPESIRASLYATPKLGGNVEGFIWRGIVQAPGRRQIFGKGLQAEVAIAEYYGVEIQLECHSRAGG